MPTCYRMDLGSSEKQWHTLSEVKMSEEGIKGPEVPDNFLHAETQPTTDPSDREEGAFVGIAYDEFATLFFFFS